MKNKYDILVDSCSTLSDEQKLLIKSTWLQYLKSCDFRAWNGWWNHHILSLVVIVIGVLIPILDGAEPKYIFFGKSISIVGVLGIFIAIITGIISHWKFESRWKHYRLNTEIMRAEGEDFFALSNRYSEFENHSEGFKEFISSITKFKRNEIEVYIETMKDHNKNKDHK